MKVEVELPVSVFRVDKAKGEDFGMGPSGATFRVPADGYFLDLSHRFLGQTGHQGMGVRGWILPRNFGNLTREGDQELEWLG